VTNSFGVEKRGGIALPVLCADRRFRTEPIVESTLESKTARDIRRGIATRLTRTTTGTAGGGSENRGRAGRNRV
jgi:hypothetical protein